MNIYLVIGFIFICTITSCSFANSWNKSTTLLGQDDQYYFAKENASVPAMAESEDGYYFFSGPELSYLFFMDKKTMKVQVLCNKPDCLHYDEPDPSKKANCNAFFNITNANMIYYNGNLYVLDSFGSAGLYQVSPDGTRKKRIYNFKDPLSSLIIHRGYIYYTTAETLEMSDMQVEKETKSQVYRLDLSNLGKGPELLYQIEGYNAYISQLTGFENIVYFQYNYCSDNLLQDDNSAIMSYDISNKKINEIKTDAGRYAICGDYMVYYWKGKIYRCGMDGIGSICLDQAIGFPISSEKYILTDTIANGPSKRKLMVYDLDGNEITSVDISTFQSANFIYGCVGNLVFIPDNSSQQNEFGPILSLWTIDLNDINTGAALAPKKIFEFVPKVEDNGVSTGRN